MRKSLLVFAFAMLGSVGVMAQVREDVTPKGYNWAEVKEPNFCKVAWAGSNIPTPVTQTVASVSDPTVGFDNSGIIAVTGGQMGNQTNYKNLQQGCSIVDFGGEVGKVFCYSGKNSKVNEVITKDFPQNFTKENNTKMDVKNAGQVGGWYNLNFFTDIHNTPKAPSGWGNSRLPNEHIRVRIVFNVYSNNLSESDDLIGKEYMVSDQGGVLPQNDNSATEQAIKTGVCSKFYDDDPANGPEEDEDGNAIWDPTRWRVMEFDTFCPADDPQTTYAPLRLKMEFSPKTMPNSTLFIKEIKFYKVTGTDDKIVGTRKTEYVKYNVSPTTDIVKFAVSRGYSDAYSISGHVVSFKQDATVHNLSGATVGVVKAGESVTLTPGIYVATIGKGHVKFVVR